MFKWYLGSAAQDVEQIRRELHDKVQARPQRGLRPSRPGTAQVCTNDPQLPTVLITKEYASHYAGILKML